MPEGGALSRHSAAVWTHLPLRLLGRLLSILLLPLSVLGGPLAADAASPKPAKPAKPSTVDPKSLPGSFPLYD